MPNALHEKLPQPWKFLAHSRLNWTLDMTEIVALQIIGNILVGQQIRKLRLLGAKQTVWVTALHTAAEKNSRCA